MEFNVRIFILFVYWFCDLFDYSILYIFLLTPVYNGAKSQVPGESSKNISNNGYLQKASLRQSIEILLHYRFLRTFHAKMIEEISSDDEQPESDDSDSEITLISGSIYEIF